jgi:hypothetical protein
MEKRYLIYIVSILAVMAHASVYAQTPPPPVAVAIPSETAAEFVKGVLPYQIDFGKNFTGSFWIQSIDGIRITDGRVLFSTHIQGKDMAYTAKIGSQKLNIAVGNVNLRNKWNTTLRYDPEKKILYIIPQVDGTTSGGKPSEGDQLLNALIVGLSGVEFPIETAKLKPITTTVQSRPLDIRMDISNVYTAEDKLIVEIKPSATFREQKK